MTECQSFDTGDVIDGESMLDQYVVDFIKIVCLLTGRT
jgi:hypothetical protein